MADCIYVCFVGLPAVYIALFYGISHYLYVQNDLNPKFIYGDVNKEGEMYVIILFCCLLYDVYTPSSLLLMLYH